MFINIRNWLICAKQTATTISNTHNNNPKIVPENAWIHIWHLDSKMAKKCLNAK
jgi:hypothetical protein